MRKAFIIEDIMNSPCAGLNQHLVPAQEPEKKRSKYGSKKAEVDGINFDSQKEAKRYKELRLLLKAGKIGMLARQVQFELNPTGSHSLIYIADFVYRDMSTGNQVVEDCKGHLTKEYKKKRKLMRQLYNILIAEV
ncbi:DUF1064 domain-containing protein [Danxiaibacter flavus]|uniref:DUF1064 domain-containing protein n=1 Tax=Danxiaibacter flavus TaxID=3049108 RepID=A0ABV3ZMX9_9BACT|nr:DUF1064 domain-containing protein [Chitinophagaceae bacterium DXS]